MENKLYYSGVRFSAVYNEYRINYREFRVLLLYEWNIDHNVAAAARNINAALGDSSVNEITIRRCYANFEFGDESLPNKDRGRPETVVDKKSYKLVEQNSH
ncbi:hypothetical protein TNCT_679351 [Trichonephila clavata]|uniref:Mos1 transposase HTH domain-containing protein n=1 Tax=Trichonephila clavata TaxID=2740835 RepID=A0A8X6KRE2_TRICU|nr:hypothetical protein TNCT_679351 [Trichonephila clavata]